MEKVDPCQIWSNCKIGSSNDLEWSAEFRHWNWELCVSAVKQFRVAPCDFYLFEIKDLMGKGDEGKELNDTERRVRNESKPENQLAAHEGLGAGTVLSPCGDKRE